jgi:hypothetical protein
MPEFVKFGLLLKSFEPVSGNLLTQVELLSVVVGRSQLVFQRRWTVIQNICLVLDYFHPGFVGVFNRIRDFFQVAVIYKVTVLINFLLLIGCLILKCNLVC